MELFHASQQWAQRPADERYWNLREMFEATHGHYESAREVTVDLRIARRFVFGRTNVEGIFEIFNLFNRTNYTAINNVWGIVAYPSAPLPTYGKFTQAGAPRQMQFAVKVAF